MKESYNGMTNININNRLYVMRFRNEKDASHNSNSIPIKKIKWKESA